MSDIRPSQTFVECVYRFSYSSDEVNWKARAKPDRSILETLVLPTMVEWLREMIPKVTYGRPNALVGLSGGIDSSTAAYIAAEALLKLKNPSLVLVSFMGNSEKDDQYVGIVYDDIRRRYGDRINISFVHVDITPVLQTNHNFVSSLVEKSGRTQVYAGELPTRIIYTLLIEVADRIGHALIGSTNATEFVLGEFVLGCDVDISLLGGLYKSEIYEIARILEIPECVIKRRPINSTWANDKVGTYFGEIPEGLTPEEAYQVLDAVLYGLYDLRYPPSRVAIDLGHNLDFVRRVYERIRSQDHRRKIPCFAPVTFQTRYPSNLPGDFGRYEMEMMYEAAKVQNFKTND